MSKKAITAKDIVHRYDNNELVISTKFLHEVHALTATDNINLSGRNSLVHVVNNRMNRGLLIKCQEYKALKVNWEDLCYYFMYKLLHHQYSIHYCFINKESGLSAFLQPEMKLRAQLPVKQIFGNVFIDYTEDSNSPEAFKILSTVYSGYNYQKPLEFEYLVDLLFLKRIKKNL